jgi:hypothetical protein
MSRTLYVRRRNEFGAYEHLELSDGNTPGPKETVYFTCKKCGRQVVAGMGNKAIWSRDTRAGFCFEHMPAGLKLNAECEPRTDITIY